MADDRAKQEWLVAVGFLLAAALLYIVFQNRAYDDPFITFRYANNLRLGRGFVYNASERVLSTTTPLYTLVLAGLGLLWSDLPRLSNLISAFSLAVGGLCLYLMGRQWREPLAGLVAAILFPFFPLMVSTFGAETCFYVMLILGAFALDALGHHKGAIALAAFATVTRADGVLVAAVLGLSLMIRQRRVPWQPLLLFVLLAAPWYVFSWLYFGSPFPVTLTAKHSQAQMSISVGFVQGFVQMLAGYARQPLYWLHASLACMGAGYAGLRARQWLILFAWGVLYFVSYSLLGVSRYFWYYAPLAPVALAAVGLGLSAARHLFSAVFAKRIPPEISLGVRRASDRQTDFRVRTTWLEFGALVIVLAILLWPLVQGLEYMYMHPDGWMSGYRAAGLWLADNTPLESSVGALEVGVIGYYADRRMVDFAGLIQPEVTRQMRKDTTYEDTALWVVNRYQPNYLVLFNPDWFSRLMDQYVKPLCKPVRTFSGGALGFDGELVIYVCPGSK